MPKEIKISEVIGKWKSYGYNTNLSYDIPENQKLMDEFCSFANISPNSIEVGLLGQVSVPSLSMVSPKDTRLIGFDSSNTVDSFIKFINEKKKNEYTVTMEAPFNPWG